MAHPLFKTRSCLWLAKKTFLSQSVFFNNSVNYFREIFRQCEACHFQSASTFLPLLGSTLRRSNTKPLLYIFYLFLFPNYYFHKIEFEKSLTSYVNPLPYVTPKRNIVSAPPLTLRLLLIFKQLLQLSVKVAHDFAVLDDAEFIIFGECFFYCLFVRNTPCIWK